MPLPDEAGEEFDDAISEEGATLGDVHVGISRKRGDLDRRGGFDALAARDGEGSRFIGPCHAACAFRAVEARALCGAHRLVAQLRVADVRGFDGLQQLDGSAVREQLVVREPRRRSVRVGHAP